MSAIATEGAPHSQQQVPPTPLESQESSGMKRKIVIKVAMDGQKTRFKALKIAVSVSGVESAALAGPDKNHIEVIGDGIDSVALTTLLRKNVGYSELMSVGPVPMNKVVGYYYPHYENAYESSSVYEITSCVRGYGPKPDQFFI